MLVHVGQERFEQAATKSGDPGDGEYLAACYKARQAARGALEGALIGYNLDAVVALTGTPAWLTDYVLGDHLVFVTSSPSAVAGYPAICVPAGFVAGLPVGISFIGAAWSEPTLIALAYAFEQACRARK